MKRKLLATLLALCLCLALLPTAVFADAPGTYHTGDIAAINSIIDTNEPTGMTKAPSDGSLSPDDWKNIVYWDYSSTPRRVNALSLVSKDLSGTLDLTGLPYLTHVYCNNNEELTGINVSGMTSLEWLECNNNQLSAINVSDLTNLTRLECAANRLTGTLDVSNLPNLTTLVCAVNRLTKIKLNGTATYNMLWVFANSLEDTYAVTGAGMVIPWSDNFGNPFVFNPQHPTIKNNLTNITSDNPATRYFLDTDTFEDYTATLSADEGYALPDEIVVRVADRVLTRGEDEDYTYDSTSGELNILGDSLIGDDPPSSIGDIEIIASGVPMTSVYSVSVETEGKGSASATPISGPAGTVITLVASADSGWEFKEWIVVSGGAKISENKFRMPNSDVAVKAVFKKKTASPVKPTKPHQSLPATGENLMSIYLWASLLLFSASGLLLVLRKRRMSKQSD